MSKAMDLLRRLVEGDNRGDFFISNELLKEAEAILAQPELSTDSLQLTEQEPFAVVANNSVGFDVSHSPQGMPLVWLGKLEYGDKLYRVRARDE
jgi:hypothetical protein